MPPPAPVPVTHLPYVDKHGRQVMPTPKDNVAMAAKLLETDRSPAAVDQVYQFYTKAMQQQENADSSRKLASDSKAC